MIQDDIATEKVKMRVDFDCSICMSDVVVPVVTQCGHLFCWGCIHAWGSKSSICPVCKNVCMLSTVIPIYSKGTRSGTAHLSHPPLPTPTCVSPDRIMNMHYSNHIRMYHIEGAEYRRNMYSKPCTATKLFYIFILMFCIALFLFVD